MPLTTGISEKIALLSQILHGEPKEIAYTSRMIIVDTEARMVDE